MIEFFVDLHERAPVIAGALISLLGLVVGWMGGFFTNMYNHRRQSRKEKIKVLHSNLLTIMLESSKIHAWAEKESAFYADCSKKELKSLSKRAARFPTEKIRVIAILYFPQLHEKVGSLADAALAHRMALTEYAALRLTGQPAHAIEAQYDETQKVFIRIVKAQAKFEKAAEKLMADFLDENLPNDRKIFRLFDKLRRS